MAQRMRDMLDAFAECFQLNEACRRAGICRGTHYTWMETKPDYKDSFEALRNKMADFIESEAVRRATEGWDEPIYYQGTQCGTVRRFDGGVTQQLLRGLRPEVYGAKTELSGPGGQPLSLPRLEVVFVKPDEPKSDDPG